MKFDLSGFAETDRFAAQSYCAIHRVPPEKNLGDVCGVTAKSTEPFNMICGGSPCQDFSTAGMGKGSVWECRSCGCRYNPVLVDYVWRPCCPHCASGDVNKTRSSLLVEYLRLVHEGSPRFGIYENVKNITGKKFRQTFDAFLHELEMCGYRTYWQVLNACDYGIPQRRERAFVVFIKKELDNGQFRFPEPFENGVRLGDLLESQAPAHLYFKTDTPIRFVNPEKAYCIDANYWKGTNYEQYRKRKRRQLVAGDAGTLRMLTPLECWRLMGFSDDDFYRAAYAGASNTQLYRQAGNSIVVDVLYYIFRNLLDVMPWLFADLRVLSLFSGIGAFEKALSLLPFHAKHPEVGSVSGVS